MRSVRILPFILGIVGFLRPAAHAGTLVLDILENTGATGSSGNQSLGWQFQVNTPILVDGLAFWNHTDTQNHDVGIFNDTTQTLLVSTTVLPTDPVSGTGPWRVHSIAPFLLTPGIYDIAAETNSDNYTYNPTSMSTASQITWLQDRFEFGASTLMFPSQSSGGGLQGWFGPSFTATDAAAVPEPASFALLGVGLVALAAVARRRRAR